MESFTVQYLLLLIIDTYCWNVSHVATDLHALFCWLCVARVHWKHPVIDNIALCSYSTPDVTSVQFIISFSLTVSLTVSSTLFLYRALGAARSAYASLNLSFLHYITFYCIRLLSAQFSRRFTWLFSYWHRYCSYWRYFFHFRSPRIWWERDVANCGVSAVIWWQNVGTAAQMSRFRMSFGLCCRESCMKLVGCRYVVTYSKRAYVPEVIPVLGSQPAGDRSHKPGARLPLLSASARGCFLIRGASPPFGRYQITPLSDRGTLMWTICPELHSTARRPGFERKTSWSQRQHSATELR